MLRLARPLAPALAFLLLTGVAPAQEFKTAEQAASVGIAHARAQDWEAARGPLEAARKMMLADREEGARADFRLRNLHEALMATYSELGETEALFETGEWLMRNTDHAAGRSLTGRRMLGYARSKKDRDLLRGRFEEDLKKDAGDRIALVMLSDVAEADRDYDRAAELLGKYIALDRGTGTGPEPRARIEHARLLDKADKHEAAAKEYAELAAEAAKVGGDPTETFGPSSTAGNLWLKSAQAWVSAGDEKQAAAAAARAEEAGDEYLDDPHPYYFHSFLGGVYRDLDETAKAIPHLEKAVELARFGRESDEKKLEEARAELEGK